MRRGEAAEVGEVGEGWEAREAEVRKRWMQLEFPRKVIVGRVGEDPADLCALFSDLSARVRMPVMLKVEEPRLSEAEAATLGVLSCWSLAARGMSKPNVCEDGCDYGYGFGCVDGSGDGSKARRQRVRL
jgi:hypothetical protein